MFICPKLLDAFGADFIRNGRLYKAGDFEGVGGPEDKARINAETNPGSDDVTGNVRQK